MDTQFDKKVKTKNEHGCFEINSKFWISVHCFFPNLLYRHELKGNKNYFELTGGLSNRGFKLAYG